MKTHLLILLMAVAPTALGQVATAKSSPSSRSIFGIARTGRDKAIHPGRFMTGKLHWINARAYNDGLVNTYFLQAEGTEFGKGQTYQTKVR